MILLSGGRGRSQCWGEPCICASLPCASFYLDSQDLQASTRGGDWSGKEETLLGVKLFLEGCSGPQMVLTFHQCRGFSPINRQQLYIFLASINQGHVMSVQIY